MSDLKFKLFTWNFGRSNDNKLKCISAEMFDIIDPNTIYVVGLQEINYFDLGKIKKYFENNKPNTHTMIDGRKSSLKDFDLVTLIFYPNDVSLDNLKFTSQKIPSKKGRSTILDTKGYLWADFTINGIEYTIVNIHLPFQNEEFSLHNFQLLFETFQYKKNVIIFGDYNTRSKVGDSCLIKKICHDNDEECLNEQICDVKFEKDTSDNVVALESNLNFCKKNPKGEICEPLKKQLFEYDYLNQEKGIMKYYKEHHYNEHDIDFLPSYKINNNGNYSLIKNGKRRLVGYADRILVKGDNLKIVENSYKRIDCLGNDHFPIVLEVSINDNNSEPSFNNVPPSNESSNSDSENAQPNNVFNFKGGKTTKHKKIKSKKIMKRKNKTKKLRVKK